MTQWRRQRETRAFFSWPLCHDYIPTNPFAKVKNIKMPQKLIQPFTQEEVLTPVACCDADSCKGTRDHTLVLHDTGLRAACGTCGWYQGTARTSGSILTPCYTVRGP